jgi:CubicO group peptidase (beta-lactamase class C family)
VGNPYAGYTEGEAYAFLSGYALKRAPGSKYEYSNYGAALLGRVLAKAAGRDYETLIRRRICGPLKMRHTGITLRKMARSGRAEGYDRFGNPVVSYLPFDFFEGAGAMRSTVHDLLLFASANLPGAKTPLDAAIRLSHTIQDTTGMPAVDVALGWHTFRRYGHHLLWHNGQTGGFKSFIGIDSAGKRAVVLLTNGGNPVDDIGLHALDSRYRLQTFKYPWIIKDTMTTVIRKEGIDAALRLYRRLRAEPRADYVFNEMQLSLAGTGLLQEQKRREAIALFQLNTQEYPASWRAFHALGGSCMEAGQKEPAREAFEKSVALNPDNSEGLEKLKALQRR